MAAKKDITEYCFFRFNTLGNSVTSVNIFKSTSRADIVKQWKDKSGGSDISPIFKGFVPHMPKKKKADPVADFWTKLFTSAPLTDQPKKSTKKSNKKSVKKGSK
jgi:hypothetical protein